MNKYLEFMGDALFTITFFISGFTIGWFFVEIIKDVFKILIK